MSATKRYYWDSCAWIALIKRESGRVEALEAIYESAQRGEVEIWTSAIALVEVHKPNNGKTALTEEQAKRIENLFALDIIYVVNVDIPVTHLARKLLIENPKIKKPYDAVHLATATMHNVDELHTYDGRNLMPLDGKLKCSNGNTLKICEAPKPSLGPLFESQEVASEEHKAGK